MTLADSDENRIDKDQSLLDALSKNYKIQEQIGRGGMSTVYRAENLVLNNEVAIKLLNTEYGDSDTTKARFLNEAKICSQLEHPNIVQIKAFGFVQETVPYIVMELLHGENLAEHFAKTKTLSPREFKQIFLPTLDAIEFAHSKGLIHRDLKPSNIFLQQRTTNEDDDDVAEFEIKVLDFGIAKRVGLEKDGISPHPTQNSNQQLTTGLLGSPLYMSPEQCEGKAADFRSDIYSLACVMFQAIEGKAPFESETAYQTMYARLNEVAPKFNDTQNLSAFPERLTKTILKCLNRSPQERLQTITELRKETFASFESESLSQKSSSKRKRNALIPLTVMGLLIGSAIIFYSQARARKNPGAQITNITPMEKLQQFGKIKHAEGFGSMALREAELLRENNRLDEAITKYNQLIAEFNLKKDRADITKLNYKAHRSLAEIYLLRKEPDKAFSEFEKTLANFEDVCAPNRINVLTIYAIHLANNGQLKKAMALLQKDYAEIDETAPARSAADYFGTLALLEEKANNLKEAEKLNDRAIQELSRTPLSLCSSSAIDYVFNQYRVEKKLHHNELAKKLIDFAKDSIPPDSPKTPGGQYSFALHAKNFPELRKLAITYFKKAIESSRLDDTPGETHRIKTESQEYIEKLSAEH